MTPPLDSSAPRRPVPQPLLQRVRAYFRLYEADDSRAPSFRARQLAAMLSFTPGAMLINLLNAAIITGVLWRLGFHAFLLGWSALVSVLALLGLRGWYRASHRPPRSAASHRAMRHAVGQAAVLGLVWALLPAVLFPRVDAGGQFFIGMVITGMICAAGFVLSSVPWAATAYVLAAGTGAVVALAQWPDEMVSGVLLMLTAYIGVVLYSVWTYARSFGARLLAEAQAAHQHEVIGLLLRDFEDHASDLLWELDARGRFAHVSPRFAERLRRSPTALARVNAARLLQRRVPFQEEAQAHWQVLQGRMQARVPFRDCIVTLQGEAEPTWWAITARPLFRRDGAFDGWRGVATDITDRQLAHRRLRWLAHHDALTGLVNRTPFLDLLQALLTDAKALGRTLAVVTFDLDGFKQVNDSQGHAAGDQLLKAFAERLQAAARRQDTVARLGGDEFAVLVQDVSGEAEIAPFLQRLQAALQAPCRVGDTQVPLRVSMGVALGPQHGDDVDTLMNHADVALYAAKRAGGHQACFFHQAMAEGNRRRVAVEQALRDALARGEFHLVYQPQVSAKDGALLGFEALLRWRHAVLGEVSPVEFIAIAEAAGLMPQIGEWVLAQACREAAGWPAPLQVAVNVSATQLAGPGFVARVQQAMGAWPAARLELEITESALIDDPDTAVATLNTLRALGLRIALDDFGTGYSALGYLRRFPFDTLKIDRSFVRDLARHDEARVIVDTILAMARSLRMTTVAEGVETPDEIAILQAKGCHALQGYLISRPMPPAAVPAFLADWPTRAHLFAPQDGWVSP